ncbi:MAG: squalene synthase HpnC [Bryobacteraceae bacterium]
MLAPKDFVHSPEALAKAYTVAEAEAYTRWLSTNHYENFHIVSFLLPKHLHQDFYNVYAFCRWADDLGDEMGDPDESLRLLAWWRRELHGMYEDSATHPVFVALQGTAAKHQLPRMPFDDLITAFERDQTITRYPTYEHLFEYCKYSANPVGRLVLYLCGYSDEERQRLSDATCTALQLANFWQDVSVDLLKDRVYIPLEAMERHGYTEDELFAHRETQAFQAVMKEVTARTRLLFEEGLPLVNMVNRRLSLDLDLFSRGGMMVLDKIERQHYLVLGRRPAISKTERLRLLLGSLVRVAFSKAA